MNERDEIISTKGRNQMKVSLNSIKIIFSAVLDTKRKKSYYAENLRCFFQYELWGVHLQHWGYLCTLKNDGLFTLIILCHFNIYNFIRIITI